MKELCIVPAIMNFQKVFIIQNHCLKYHYWNILCQYIQTLFMLPHVISNVFFLRNLLLKSNTKGNFRDRFPISKWMKSLKYSQILRWYRYIFGGMYLIWMNKCYFIYLQHGSFKFMDVNSSVTPLKIATCTT
jgi:hypothetical protein